MTSNGREIIRLGYLAGRPVKDIARDCDSTRGSVKVIAHRMGLKHRKPVPGVQQRARPSFAGQDRHELPWGGPTVTGALRQ